MIKKVYVPSVPEEVQKRSLDCLPHYVSSVLRQEGESPRLRTEDRYTLRISFFRSTLLQGVRFLEKRDAQLNNNIDTCYY